jgi:uncharacterized protein YcaQ
MHVLQIDTIHVVNRSPYFVLWSRIGDYHTAWLEELLAEGALFEYWSHAACFLPIEDYPLYRRMMLDRLKGWSSAQTWIESHPEAISLILNYIRDNGPARSADFSRTDGQRGGWWNWKEEKIALEVLFNSGELMIAGRRNFNRIYDLRERVLPDWDDALAPPYHPEIPQTLALRTVNALGVSLASWVPDYFRVPKKGSSELLKSLAAEERLIPAQIEGFKEPAYIHPENRELLEGVLSGDIQPAHTTLLSPFDPIVWDRKRASDLFNFDYQIECYTPAPKRIYGYFSLPILWHGQLVGRLDAKAHRKDRLFEVKILHLEPGVAATDELLSDISNALRACAQWHKTPSVIVRESKTAAVARKMNKLLSR